MGRLTTTPISTSQTYGNFYRTLNYLPKTSLSLKATLSKSTLLPLIRTVGVSKKPTNSIKYLLNNLSGMELLLQKQSRNKLSKVLEFRPTLVALIKSNEQLGASLIDTLSKPERVIFNMRQVTRYKNGKRGARPLKRKLLRRQKFFTKVCGLLKRSMKAHFKKIRNKLRRSLRMSR